MPFKHDIGDSAPKIKTRKELSPSRLREVIDYDRKSGEMRWRQRPLSWFSSPRVGRGWNTKYAGKIVTQSEANGYGVICVWNQKFLAHRVIWALHYNENPPDVIDHINRDGLDNRIENLRSSSDQENAKNRIISANNRSGITGIWALRPKKWGKRWAVALGGQGKMTYKRHACLGRALAHRNAVWKSLGYYSGHGSEVRGSS